MRVTFEATGFVRSLLIDTSALLRPIAAAAKFQMTKNGFSGRKTRFFAPRTVQFIWAVFSAFPVGYHRNIEQAPYVDDNPLILAKC